jgi:hypothetical protein
VSLVWVERKFQHRANLSSENSKHGRKKTQTLKREFGEL